MKLKKIFPTTFQVIIVHFIFKPELIQVTVWNLDIATLCETMNNFYRIDQLKEKK